MTKPHSLTVTKFSDAVESLDFVTSIASKTLLQDESLVGYTLYGLDNKPIIRISKNNETTEEALNKAFSPVFLKKQRHQSGEQ